MLTCNGTSSGIGLNCLQIYKWLLHMDLVHALIRPLFLQRPIPSPTPNICKIPHLILQPTPSSSWRSPQICENIAPLPSSSQKQVNTNISWTRSTQVKTNSSGKRYMHVKVTPQGQGVSRSDQYLIVHRQVNTQYQKQRKMSSSQDQQLTWYSNFIPVPEGHGVSSQGQQLR